MISWEYLFHTRLFRATDAEDSRKLLTSELNALGSQGWEVCGFSSNEVNQGWQLWYTFKRQKQGM
jgi:hypothetical protein